MRSCGAAQLDVTTPDGRRWTGGEATMGRQPKLVRMWMLASDLLASRRGVPLKQLADLHGWDLRSTYRLVESLEEAGVPVIHDEQRFRIDPKWSGGLEPGITS